MISKERLEELIEQGSQVWKIYKDTCQGVYQVPAGLFGIGFSSQVDETTPFNELFETEEEAVFYKEFGCIERTERLELPTWETFRVIGGFSFYDYKHNPISMIICLDPVNVAPCNDCIYIADKKNQYFCMPKTKENYTLACRKCKELFLGEKYE